MNSHGFTRRNLKKANGQLEITQRHVDGAESDTEQHQTPAADAPLTPASDADAALAQALAGAVAAGQWTIVSQLAAELEARRKARGNGGETDGT